jgi:glucose-1-phosphate adenylyltransferase
MTTLDKPYHASTGIYVFGIDALIDLLKTETGDDFGHNIIPNALSRYSVKGFHFEGFWEDIGSLRRYYEVNLKLASEFPPFDFYDPERPIYSRPRFLPGSTVDNSRLERILLGEGCRIHGAAISDAVIGTRSIIGSDTIVRNSIVMGADYF